MMGDAGGGSQTARGRRAGRERRATTACVEARVVSGAGGPLILRRASPCRAGGPPPENPVDLLVEKNRARRKSQLTEAEQVGVGEI